MVEARFVGIDPELFEGFFMYPGSSVDAQKVVIRNDLQVVETRVSSEFVVLKNISKSWITS